MDNSIFKSYDIRGVYPVELNKDAAYQIGTAFLRHTKAKNIVVGYDARLSSPDLLRALAAGLLSEGAKITAIGQMPTECLYFALARYDFDAGIMVTASHNPKEYNGLKMMVKKNGDIIWVQGKDLLPLVESNTASPTALTAEPAIGHKDILEDYRKYIFSLFDLGKIKKFKVVIDASNGVVGNIISRIALPVEIIPLNFTPDGNFPNHAPNPLELGSADQIKEAIKKNKADFGFIFDGDADRIFLVNEKGRLVSADITLLLIARYFLEKNPGGAIAYNAICSKSVPEFIKKWGGVPVRTPVGFVNVREGLIKHRGIMGGELSAHYCFRDYFYTDSGLIALLALLQIISQDDRKVSEIVKELSMYFKSAELNFKIDNKEKILQKIKEKYADGKQDYLDGVTVEYQDWWFNVRPSNTEPLLRLTIEADTRSLLDEKKQELTVFLMTI